MRMPFSGILRFCLALQTNSIRLNAAWAINISWLVFTLKLSTIKISRAIDNTAVTKEYKQDVYCYLNFFPAVRHFAEYVNRPGRRRVGRCQISYKRSVNLSRGKVCFGYWRPYKWAENTSITGNYCKYKFLEISRLLSHADFLTIELSRTFHWVTHLSCSTTEIFLM